jgi:alpha,alpha-trehalose phosphorylase
LHPHDEQKARNFAYYEGLTVRDSSLSACTQAIVAAEIGHLELAYDYFGEAALLDLQDLQQNTRDGVHIGSLAGVWLVAVAGFGGMRDHDGILSFAPRLPPQLERLRFRLLFRGRQLRVDIRSDEASYTSLNGDPLEILHHGEPVTVSPEAPVVRTIAPVRHLPSPAQPHGRAPAGRRGPLSSNVQATRPALASRSHTTASLAVQPPRASGTRGPDVAA